MLKFQDGNFKDPEKHALLCVEEPENQLYPQLLFELAEEFRLYSEEGGQVFISTHSPDFINAVRLEELYCFVKEDGYTRVYKASGNDTIKELYRAGDLLGQPDVKFVIVQDQDSAECTKVKELLGKLAEPSGREVLIRIACRELESWYFGDLGAVSMAYGQDIRGLSQKRKYRNPDLIGNPREELRKLFPGYQQLEGARKIAIHMDIENNSSTSFQYFVSGVRKLCEKTGS